MYTQKSSTYILRICVYAQKIHQMTIIKSSNNPIVDVMRPAQKLQVWKTYTPAERPESCILHASIKRQYLQLKNKIRYSDSTSNLCVLLAIYTVSSSQLLSDCLCI